MCVRYALYAYDLKLCGIQPFAGRSRSGFCGTETMHGEYYVHLLCPYCHWWKWLRLQRPQLSLEDVLGRCWVFRCPVHGVLREKPLQAQESRVPFRAHRSISIKELFD
jgi:hypothetical protein